MTVALGELTCSDESRTMGIRFYCPNGHKLNVKSFLAGRRGYCPECGVKLIIPAETDPGSKSPDALPVAAAVNEQAESQETTDESGSSKLIQTEESSYATAVSGETSAEVVSHDAPAAEPIVEMKSGDAAPPASVVPSDPFLDQPNAIWHVQIPGGQRYGPAEGALVRRWFDEGRIPGDALLWREGWSEWRPANDVIPANERASSVSTPQEAPVNTATAGTPPTDVVATPIESPVKETAASNVGVVRSRRRARKRRNQRWLAVLALTALLLGALLTYVVLNPTAPNGG